MDVKKLIGLALFFITACNQEVEFFEAADTLQVPDKQEIILDPIGDIEESKEDGDVGQTTPTPVDPVDPPKPPAPQEKWVQQAFYQQDGSTDVDVLFVIDNSYSMDDNLANLANRFDSFIDGLQGLNWQIGMITAEGDGWGYWAKGKLLYLQDEPGEYGSVRIIKPHMSNGKDLFRETLLIDDDWFDPELPGRCDLPPYCGSGDEKPFQALLKAIDERNDDNQGMFRDGTHLAVVFLTDEDDDSDFNGNDVQDYVKAAWGQQKGFSAHGIIIKDQACKNEDHGGAKMSDKVHALIQATGGHAGSICDVNYGQVVEAVADQLVERLGSVDLIEEPVNPDDIEVVFTPDQQVDWEIDGKKIIFNSKVKPGTSIDIRYRTQ